MPINYTARAAAMEDVSKWMKMTYHVQDEWGLMSKLLDFELFRTGRQKTIFNLLEWKDAFMEEQVYIFDYAYTRGSGKSKKRYMQTVFFMNSKFLGLPEFLMKPETFFHKIGQYLGLQDDIDFIEHEKFSEQYLLQSDDEARLRSLMNKEILHFFTVEQNWTLEGIGYFMVFYKNDRLLSPATVKHFYSRGMALYDQFKNK